MFSTSGTATYVECAFTDNTMTYGVVAAGDSSKTGRVHGMLVRARATSFAGNDGTTFAALESSNSPIFYRCAVPCRALRDVLCTQTWPHSPASCVFVLHHT